MADFPVTKKTWADLVDNVSPANSSDINSAYAEITAIEDMPTDSMSLNASTDIHGFMPKLSGTVTEYLDGTGAWSTPAGGTAGGGVTLSNIERFTSSGTWTKPAGLHHVIVEAVGGGGGGGGVTFASNQSASGGGGGGGGYSKKLILESALDATETVTIGLGGTAGAAGNNNGGDGGTSSFGVHLSATGGGGGTGQAASATFPGPGGQCGKGGTGTGGDINSSGNGGLRGVLYSSTLSVSGGGGAACMYSGATSITLSDIDGEPGNAFGGGARGANASNAAADYAGGAGAAGVVIVYEYTEA